jgi:hypothetical protein
LVRIATVVGAFSTNVVADLKTIADARLSAVQQVNADNDLLQAAREYYKEHTFVIGMLNLVVDELTAGNKNKRIMAENKVLQRLNEVQKAAIVNYQARNGIVKNTVAQRGAVVTPPAANAPAPAVREGVTEITFTDDNPFVGDVIKFEGKKQGTVAIPHVKMACVLCGAESVAIDEANYSHRKIRNGLAICKDCQNSLRKIMQENRLQSLTAALDSVLKPVQAPVQSAPVQQELAATGTEGADFANLAAIVDEEQAF